MASEALNDAGVKGEDLDGIGITNQRETAVAWDRDSGEPLHRAIVWQDRRTAGYCDRAARAGPRGRCSASAPGSCWTPYFSGTKYRWLLARGRGRTGAPCSARSTPGWSTSSCGEHVTDVSNASRTLLFNIRDGGWDGELCDLLDVPDRRRCPSRWATRRSTARTSVFGGSVPVCGMAGDQQAALFGQACLEPGSARTPTAPATSCSRTRARARRCSSRA